ncbi:MAG: hypothetical protein RLZZ292_2193 [Bacteroidota bacterium]|jgi:hypothetical protein
MSKNKRIPPLPKLLQSKIYKTGQTRGADDDVIFQNRVNRNSTVLIPYSFFEQYNGILAKEAFFENDFIVLINPEDYFEVENVITILASQGLELGKNALLFYYSREQWNKFNPVLKGLKLATARKKTLGGEYVARIPATTADIDTKIQHGFSTTALKGAGIRVYEYASSETIKLCQIQLEYIFWQCFDATLILEAEGMSKENISERKIFIEGEVTRLKLNEAAKLVEARILNARHTTICPLCLEEISASGLF